MRSRQLEVVLIAVVHGALVAATDRCNGLCNHCGDPLQQR